MGVPLDAVERSSAADGMIDHSVNDVFVWATFLWARVVTVDLVSLFDMFGGIVFCSCQVYPVVGGELISHWRMGEPIVLTLCNQYSVKTDSAEDAIFFECNDFWLSL